MDKIKFLKKYIYKTISNIDFYVIIYFDYDNEKLLYSLKYEDVDYYDSVDYLIEYATSFDEETINNTIKTFMLDCIWSRVNCYIEENNYNNGRVLIIDNGLKLKNKLTNQWVAGNIYDYDEDYDVIQTHMEKFLKLQHSY